MSDLYAFKFKYTKQDKTGYYYTRWDLAVTAEVVGKTRSEALDKLWTLLGECIPGYCWVAKDISVRDHRIVDKESND